MTPFLDNYPFLILNVNEFGNENLGIPSQGLPRVAFRSSLNILACNAMFMYR